MNKIEINKYLKENNSDEKSDQSQDLKKEYVPLYIAFFILIMVSFFAAIYFSIKHFKTIKKRASVYQETKEIQKRMQLQEKSADNLRTFLNDEELLWFSGITSTSKAKGYLIKYFITLFVLIASNTCAFVINLDLFHILGFVLSVIFFTLGCCLAEEMSGMLKIVYGITPTRIIIYGILRNENEYKCNYIIGMTDFEKYETHSDQSQSLLLAIDPTEDEEKMEKYRNGEKKLPLFTSKIGIFGIFEMEIVKEFIQNRKKELDLQRVQQKQERQYELQELFIIEHDLENIEPVQVGIPKNFDMDSQNDLIQNTGPQLGAQNNFENSLNQENFEWDNTDIGKSNNHNYVGIKDKYLDKIF
ncbi:hypothetical protein M0812_28506 [Anaeramoeba flamelloides]|uniref:Transmembrane protein n=1 Tax=Anaeramoeba flamelloides TaxID=1746091 RepID=A0AAV7Y8B1_9EUKA|nr:hypothetical protein M0812_28506 [Anaeramoeba flamelloides]